MQLCATKKSDKLYVNIDLVYYKITIYNLNKVIYMVL